MKKMSEGFATLAVFEFEDGFEMKKLARDSKGKVKHAYLDNVDLNFFNDDDYFEEIYAAYHCFVASRYNGYPMIPGLPLVTPTETKMSTKQENHAFCQRLHVQVAVRSGFDRSLLYDSLERDPLAYVVHHLNHNRFDARRANLLCVPFWVNLKMQKRKKKRASTYHGVFKSGSNFGVRFYVDGIAYAAICGKEEEAAAAYLQLLFDFVCNEPGYSRWVRCWDCSESKWVVKDSFKLMFVDDIRQFDQEAATKIELLMKNVLHEARNPIARLEYLEDRVIMRTPGKAQLVRGGKHIEIDLE